MVICFGVQAPSKYGNYVIEDIQGISRSETREEFDEANNKFQNKWKQENHDVIDDFLAGFEKTWVKSNESNQQSGPPVDHDNGLEAKNRDPKKNKTLRQNILKKRDFSNSFVETNNNIFFNRSKARLWT